MNHARRIALLIATGFGAAVAAATAPIVSMADFLLKADGIAPRKHGSTGGGVTRSHMRNAMVKRASIKKKNQARHRARLNAKRAGR